jgi:hypothetical protein
MSDVIAVDNGTEFNKVVRKRNKEDREKKKNQITPSQSQTSSQ